MAESPDDPAAPKVKIPAEVVMGNETKPAREMTVKQYDLEQFSQFRTQQLMGAVIMGLVYYKWQSLMPLVLQLLLTPINLYEHQLFQIYVMNQEIQRPFPKPNPFGMPEPAAAPALTGGADGSQTSSAEYAFTTAEFGKEHDVAGPVCRADPLQADMELVNKSEMEGKVAVVARGLVPFVDKARRAMEAGAVGIIVINDEDSLYKCTAAGADCTDIEIPVVCVRQSLGSKLTNGTAVSLAGVAQGQGSVVFTGAATAKGGGNAQSRDAAQSEGHGRGDKVPAVAEDGVRKTAAGKKKSSRE